MPATEATLTIAAPRGIRGSACLQHRNVPRALTANAFSQSSSAMSGVRSVLASTPAQLTRMCTSGPTASNSARTDDSSATSVRTNRPTSRLSLRFAITTSAPSSASRRATARPMPEPPPVTTATFPANSVTRNMLPDGELLPRW